MKANWWSKRIIAASLGVCLLFTGNSLVGRGAAAQPEETVAVTDSAQTRMPETWPPTTEPAIATQPPQIDWAQLTAEADGEHIFVYDILTEQMLYCSAEETDKLYPASITKLWSALVALMYLDPEEVVTAGAELKLVKSGSSRAYVGRGCKLTVEMLIEGMLIPSGNDAAYVVAAAAGRKIAEDPEMEAAAAVTVFLGEMNRKAEEMGLESSHFVNPDGYHDEDHYMCPKDVALVGALALENRVIARYIGLQQDSVTFETGEHIAWYNTNHLINPESPYFSPFAVGMKTGYTDEAGQCLLAAFRDGRREVIVGIFGAQQRYQRYADALALFDACPVR